MRDNPLPLPYVVTEPKDAFEAFILECLPDGVDLVWTRMAMNSKNQSPLDYENFSPIYALRDSVRPQFLLQWTVYCDDGEVCLIRGSWVDGGEYLDDVVRYPLGDPGTVANVRSRLVELIGE